MESMEWTTGRENKDRSAGGYSDLMPIIEEQTDPFKQQLSRSHMERI